jgi:hypothetical protein
MIEHPYDYMMLINIIALKYELWICYMCTIWMKMMRLWISKYEYVICAPYERRWWNYDSLTWMYVYVHHIKFYPTTP